MQLFTYSVIGSLGVVADVTIFYLSLSLGVWYQVGNLLGYLTGTILSFSLNRIITFKVKDKVRMRFMLFLSVAALGFSMSAFVLWFLVDVQNFNSMLAKIVSLPCVLLMQFTLNKKITFKKA